MKSTVLICNITGPVRGNHAYHAMTNLQAVSQGADHGVWRSYRVRKVTVALLAAPSAGVDGP